MSAGFAIRLVAVELNATYRPSGVMAGSVLSPFPSAPGAAPSGTLTRTVVFATWSKTKISATLLVSPTTRFVKSASNATYRPSWLNEGWLAPNPPPSPCTPARPPA